MADAQRSGLADRDIEQAITALKKGAYLLKYGRRGKPKFCPFHLSNDESSLIWYSGKYEKQLKLSQVSKIIPGQRTAIFQRYPRPEKEYQSFSLICNDRSLDLICKDKDEAEVWFVALKALIARGNYHSKWRIDARSESSDSPRARTRKHSPSDVEPGDGQGIQVPSESSPQCRMGKAFSDIITYTASAKGPNQAEPASNSLASLISGNFDNTNGRSSTGDAVRVSLSSAVSSSSQGSYNEVFDALGDAFIWGEGIGDGMLGGGVKIAGSSSSLRVDALLPKALESTVVLDVHNIACGGRHAVLVTRQGEMFSWGEESGGRLGHGIEADVPHPKLIDNLSGMNIELVACGEYHTCAVTLSGDLFTWGDGIHNCGLLGHGSEASHWIPKKVSGDLDGMHVSYISCGPWHTAAVTSSGQLFTFGDGTFGALGHGDHSSSNVPREVEALRGLRTTRVACGVWHTAAVVELVTESHDPETSGNSSSGQLFTWGDGDKGCLGHGDKESSFTPKCVTALADDNICQVACGHHLTVALTSRGQVYTMGGTDYGQLGSPTADEKIPNLVKGKIADSFIEHISCGSYHVAVLTSKAELYTWGRGTNGQLGHGDNEDRDSPVLVHSLRDKQVKAAVCGSNFTAIICIHKSVSSADHSVCSGCRNQFGFRRKRHNCYNCGLVFCKACSSRKSLKASLAPNMSRPYRVCTDCYNKLKKAMESGSAARHPRTITGNNTKSSRMIDKEALDAKLQAQASRLSCAESCSRAESWNSPHDRRADSDSTFVFPTLCENFQLVSFHSSKVSTLLDGAMKKILPNSSPGSKWASLAANLLSESISPPQCSSETIDSKQMNDNLREEISSLRSQVEELNAKSQLLEAELQRKSRQLEEVSAIAAGEAEKCKSANEVIKSLSTQLKEMSETLPEGRRNNRHLGSSARHTSITANMSSSSTAELAREVENNGLSIDNQMLSYTQPGKPHWVLQAEHGVYITLSSLPTGGNELKRIRFSRKHFTEQQAEKWWAENESRVCELHNIKG